MKYGKETEKSLQNFPFDYHIVHIELIYAIVKVKKAAAIANFKDGKLTQNVCEAISIACDEILEQKYDDQFITNALQGGAGTSINMNINEVIASIASAKIGSIVDPNDDVNKSQSTNDVNPSGLKILAFDYLNKLIIEARNLANAFDKRAVAFGEVKKLGRTHLQDAVPTTLKEEFESYSSAIKNNIAKISDIVPYMLNLNLGGSAIGNCINVPRGYLENVYVELNKITNGKYTPALNLMSQTSSQTDFCGVSSAILNLCTDLSKIAKDLRILSSGPMGGFGEVHLPALQAGSSIMPGKVNPVMPEMMNQLYYIVAGKDLTIRMCAENSSLELGIMFPTIADSLITEFKLAIKALEIFRTKCIDGIEADEENCKKHLEKSTANATLLTPVLGYRVVSDVVKIALDRHITIRDVVIEKKLLTKEELNRILGS